MGMHGPANIHAFVSRSLPPSLHRSALAAKQAAPASMRTIRIGSTRALLFFALLLPDPGRHTHSETMHASSNSTIPVVGLIWLLPAGGGYARRHLVHTFVTHLVLDKKKKSLEAKRHGFLAKKHRHCNRMTGSTLNRQERGACIQSALANISLLLAFFFCSYYISGAIQTPYKFIIV